MHGAMCSADMSENLLFGWTRIAATQCKKAAPLTMGAQRQLQKRQCQLYATTHDDYCCAPQYRLYAIMQEDSTVVRHRSLQTACP